MMALLLQPSMIEVSNLPHGDDVRNALRRYFSNSQNGESAVKYVLHPLGTDDSKAIVAFQGEAVRDTVLQFISTPNSRHSIMGTNVNVRPIIFSQVYSECTAVIDPVVMAVIPNKEYILERVQREFGIQVTEEEESGGKVQLSGSLQQLQCAQLYVDSIFREQQALQLQQMTKFTETSESVIRDQASRFGAGTGDTYFEDSLRKSGNLDDSLQQRRPMARTLDEGDLSRTRQNALLSGSMPAMHLNGGLHMVKNGEDFHKDYVSTHHDEELSPEVPRFGSETERFVASDKVNDTGLPSPQMESPYTSSDRIVDEIFERSTSAARSPVHDSPRSEISEGIRTVTPRSAVSESVGHGREQGEGDAKSDIGQNHGLRRSSVELETDRRHSTGTFSPTGSTKKHLTDVDTTRGLSSTAPVLAWDRITGDPGSKPFLHQAHSTNILSRTDRPYRSLDFRMGQTGSSTGRLSQFEHDPVEQETQHELSRSGMGSFSTGASGNHIDASISSTYDIPTESVELDVTILEYMKKMQSRDLQELENKYGIKLHFNKQHEITTVTVIPDRNEEIGDHYGINVKLAKEELVSMYQTVFYAVVKETLSVDPTEESLQAFQEAVNRVKNTFQTKIMFDQDSHNHISMIGAKNSVMVAKNHILESMSVAEKSYKSSHSHSPLSPKEHDLSNGEKPKMMYVMHQGPGKSSEPTSSKRLKGTKNILPSKPQIRHKSTTGSSRSSDVGSSVSSSKSVTPRASTQKSTSRPEDKKGSIDLGSGRKSAEKSNSGVRHGVKRSSSITRMSTEKVELDGKTNRTTPTPSPRRRQSADLDIDVTSADTHSSVPKASPRINGVSPRARSSSETRTSRDSSRSKTTTDQLVGSQVDASGSLTFRTPEGIKVICCQADITKLNTDVIVNAARGSLHHVGGVAAAISDAAGPKFQQDSIRYVSKHDHLRDSEVAPQRASGRLRCEWVIHAVGPMWALYPNKNECAGVLKQTVLNALHHANVQLKARNIALPAISSGIFGVPIDVCAQSMYRAIREFSADSSRRGNINEIRVVNTEQEITAVISTIFQQLLEQDVFQNDITPRSRRSTQEDQALNFTSAFHHSQIGSQEQSSMRRSASARESRSSRSSSRNSTPRETDVKDSYLTNSGRYKSPKVSQDDYLEGHSDVTGATVPKRVYPSTNYGSQDYDGELALSHNNDFVGSLGLNSMELKLNGLPSQDYETVSHSKLLSDRSDNSHSSTHRSHNQSSRRSQDVQNCAICLDNLKSPKTLKECGHIFCSECIEDYFRHGKPVCPSCGMVYGTLKGDQPKGGRMLWEVSRATRLPGYEDTGSIIITYEIPSGRQGDHHPTPGASFKGIMRRCYLPNNAEGREVLRLLKHAFDAGLTFTISDSRTTGKTGVITWNDIHHKTSIDGGPTKFGYPDPTYLQRVKEELAAKGITSESVKTT